MLLGNCVVNLLNGIAQIRGLLSCEYQGTEKWREGFDTRMSMLFFRQIFGKEQENSLARINMSDISFDTLSAILMTALIKKVSVVKSYTM